MAQEKIKINDIEIRQPDQGLKYGFTVKRTADSQRTQDGRQHSTSLYTYETMEYSASFLSVAEASQILRLIDKGEVFRLKYFSFHYGQWRTDEFTVEAGDLEIKTLEENYERIRSLSFTMTGVNKID